MRSRYDAVLFDLFGTLVDDTGNAIPGAVDLLTGLGGARWAIVTSCPRPLAEFLIAKAQLPAPQRLVTAGDVQAGKPAPECYRLAAQRLGVVPSRCLVIEDSAAGIAAGRSAAMDVLAVLRGKPPSFAAAAAFTVEDLRKLRLVPNEGGVILAL